MRVAINGAGVAGPTLAYWLLQYGHEPVLVEQAPGMRDGGYVIDFWGVGYRITERMGLTPRLMELGYQIKEVRLVDARGRKRGGIAAEAFGRLAGGRFTSLRRSDLSAAIYGAIEGKVETIFGDGVAAIEERPGGVRVAFDRHPPRDFDLVVGADGLHSRVREMVFGPEENFEAYLGYRVAAFDVEGYRPRDELVYVSHATPGRQVSRFSMRGDKTLFLFVYRDSAPRGRLPSTDDERRAALIEAFGDMGWECPQILEAAKDCRGIYFDRVSQIRMESWVKGRTALVGDAAACVSLLAGEGTGLGIAEAYVLAGELRQVDGDPSAALARYEDRLLPFLRKKQQAAAAFASSFAPASGLGIALRNLATRLMGIPFFAERLMGHMLRDDIELPDYAEGADLGHGAA